MASVAYTPNPVERLNAYASATSVVSCTYPVYTPTDVRLTAVVLEFPASLPLPASFCPTVVFPPVLFPLEFPEPPLELVENVLTMSVYVPAPENDSTTMYTIPLVILVPLLETTSGLTTPALVLTTDGMLLYKYKSKSARAGIVTLA